MALLTTTTPVKYRQLTRLGAHENIMSIETKLNDRLFKACCVSSEVVLYKSIQSYSQLVVDSFWTVVVAAIGKHDFKVCHENIQCQIVLLTIQTGLCNRQV